MHEYTVSHIVEIMRKFANSKLSSPLLQCKTYKLAITLLLEFAMLDLQGILYMIRSIVSLAR